MYTSAELNMLRTTDPGAAIPGIDTNDGNPLPTASLKSVYSPGPFFYVPSENEVVVNQNGAVLSGYNFGSATVMIEANNVTIKDLTFQAGSSEWYCVQQSSSVSGAVIENDSFNGGSTSNLLPLAAFVISDLKMSVLNDSFLNAPGDAVHVFNGVISGNYFSGAGYSSNGQHPDAIWVPETTGPLTITDNFIDATWAPGATSSSSTNGATNSAVRITTELGNTSNVTVSGNFLLGGGTMLDVVAPTSGPRTFSNVNVSGNIVGFGQFMDFATSMAPAAIAANTVFDFTNPTYSARAWAAYHANGTRTTNLVTARHQKRLSGRRPPAARPSMATELTKNTYLAVITKTSMSGAPACKTIGAAAEPISTNICRLQIITPQGPDAIGNFNVSKDRIDLSAIQANLTTPGCISPTSARRPSPAQGRRCGSCRNRVQSNPRRGNPLGGLVSGSGNSPHRHLKSDCVQFRLNRRLDGTADRRERGRSRRKQSLASAIAVSNSACKLTKGGVSGNLTQSADSAAALDLAPNSGGHT